ncbi:methyltransferase domain-containing protein [Alloacidobacterium dinghuense]|uniref:Methyltransferase domain-containing protein n=1 Tax=Alloacidobacterium dinghuense TaxID=2763107 RepID=A0A7G8BGR3_9BACT|nr:class I SAM-dependent methyltransferase [Alloacidobacterium dinghuense]QNI31733.1 methyltransferase domain-containing protein [Alloacidobacterium dinghuense]
MPTVDLYDSAYGNYEEDVYRQIRIATYGEDFGQTSWVTNDESSEIPQLLAVTPNSHTLEIGCGSGRYALQIAETTGCSIVGLDVNEAGIRNAKALVNARGLSGRVFFEHCDASEGLPFRHASFDAAFANDVICHIPRRLSLLLEVFRVLKPLGRLLFSDALVIGGAISHEEIATRSSIGYYLFTPPGHNEELIRKAGFRLLRVSDTTANTTRIAMRWRDARDSRRDELIAVEGEPNFDGLQQFLSCVCALNSERRLLRYVYLAEKDPVPVGD